MIPAAINTSVDKTLYRSKGGLNKDSLEAPISSEMLAHDLRQGHHSGTVENMELMIMTSVEQEQTKRLGKQVIRNLGF